MSKTPAGRGLRLIELNASCKMEFERKRMGSGDPSGLQNRRDLASLGLVSSTLTRFRQFEIG